MYINRVYSYPHYMHVWGFLRLGLRVGIK